MINSTRCWQQIKTKQKDACLSLPSKWLNHSACEKPLIWGCLFIYRYNSDIPVVVRCIFPLSCAAVSLSGGVFWIIQSICRVDPLIMYVSSSLSSLGAVSWSALLHLHLHLHRPWILAGKTVFKSHTVKSWLSIGKRPFFFCPVAELFPPPIGFLGVWADAPFVLFHPMPGGCI